MIKKQKRALVCGAGGFIGSHLVKSLKNDGYWVRGVDLKYPEFSTSEAHDFLIADLREYDNCKKALGGGFDEVYQLAADMGGAGFVFTGENDFDIMHNSSIVNLHMIKLCNEMSISKIFYSSSACMYPEHNQMDPLNPKCSEDSAYPANPDSEYGWEKLFSERLYLAAHRNYNLNVRVARFHNIFGPEGTWTGGREKAPAALCRKVAQACDGGTIEIWGSGKQTRSFLFIDECVEAVRRLMESDFLGPVNIGSEEMVTIDELAKMIIDISGKRISLKHIDGPVGVQGRNSDNALIKEKLSWEPKKNLRDGIAKTYPWIKKQVEEISVILPQQNRMDSRELRS